MTRQQRELHVCALEASLIGSLDRQDLEEVVDANPKVGLRLAQLMASRLVRMEVRWADLVVLFGNTLMLSSGHAGWKRIRTLWRTLSHREENPSTKLS